jgi:hypothetical protein
MQVRPARARKKENAGHPSFFIMTIIIAIIVRFWMEKEPNNL